MGGLGVRAGLWARLLVALGGLCIVAAVVVLASWAWALLVAGILLMLFGLLLVEVPAGLPWVPSGPGDVTRVGR